MKALCYISHQMLSLILILLIGDRSYWFPVIAPAIMLILYVYWTRLPLVQYLKIIAFSFASSDYYIYLRSVRPRSINVIITQYNAVRLSYKMTSLSLWYFTKIRNWWFMYNEIEMEILKWSEKDELRLSKLKCAYSILNPNWGFIDCR